ncbi:hypothetical protein SKAU_G00235350 [Synaphobranchus kaupii]|uniref:Uncharacterized protein n=1 Tax=Synaphobranchus kaupii TaxID=118154 RepID=A0A9Q1ITP1_SYNKA|nr:hypothetical protein SKAU_G00235350 [Synaphobranchus kaupii]
MARAPAPPRCGGARLLPVLLLLLMCCCCCCSAVAVLLLLLPCRCALILPGLRSTVLHIFPHSTQPCSRSRSTPAPPTWLSVSISCPWPLLFPLLPC